MTYLETRKARDLSQYRENVEDYGTATAKVMRDLGDIAGGIFWEHGPRVDTYAANRIAEDHGSTLAELIAEAIVKPARGGSVNTLQLLHALGY
jgi:hypothetical protein